MGKRLFVAINPPGYIQQALASLDPHIQGVRWVDPGQMHLTLGFFGEVPEDVDPALREKLSAIEFRAFVLPIAGAGRFPANGPLKIVWIGVSAGHPHLFQIHKRVQEAALAVGLEADLRAWHPHIALARCRDVNANSVRKFLKSREEFDAGMFRVEAFHLYSSKLTSAGPIHTCELTVPCRGGN